MKRTTACISGIVVWILFTFLRIGFADNICAPYYQWNPNQTCIEPSSPPSNCVPRLLGFTDCWDDSCPRTANDPAWSFYKTSTWRVCWPSGQVHEYAVLATGECLTTKNSCCGFDVYQRCWGSYSDPEVGQGYFSQTTYRTNALVTRVEGCSGTPCSTYKVFGGCNTISTGQVFRRDIGCCLGNNYNWVDPQFSDWDLDGWCDDRDCAPNDPNIHTGCSGGGGGGEPDPCAGVICYYQIGEVIGTDPCCPSPILVDIAGDGFSLTDATGGVSFDLNRDGVAEHLSWTSTGSDDAFLALDRNRNGTIENGTELFGNYTPQPASPTPNGFLALAEYDKPSNGGNGDGRIDSHEAIFSFLLLWQDTNHNGISEPAELHTLPQLSVYAIDLNYRESRRTDQYGNGFRYRAKVYDAHGASVGRWAWDVFFVKL
jgi:hypothetical protein